MRSLHVLINNELVKKLKVYSAENEIDMREVVEKALAKYLSAAKKDEPTPANPGQAENS